MKVSSLYLYPIKSLQGIEVSEAEVMEKGFRYDRRWMLVGADNVVITQRTHPQLSQIKLQINASEITATCKEMEPCRIPLTIDDGASASVMVWNDQVNALVAHEVINAWFTQAANLPCRLVYMPEEATRPVKPSRARNNEHVSFADAYPYLIISQASLQDLNSRMDVPLPMHRFRPNIVVTDTDAYAEDDWMDFQIGSLHFYASGHCKRCVFTTIDQDTGKKSAEPLKTLATYRKEGSEVVFGLNAIASSYGGIRVGDLVGV